MIAKFVMPQDVSRHDAFSCSIWDNISVSIRRRSRRAGREHTLLYANACGGLGERIGRIRYDEQHGLRGGTHNARNDVAIDRGVLVEEAQPALRVATVGCALSLFVDA